MNEEQAREILKPFKHYKVFPFVWMDKDEYGNYSPMSIAEAFGFIAGLEAERERAKPLVEALKYYHGEFAPRVVDRHHFPIHCDGCKVLAAYTHPGGSK